VGFVFGEKKAKGSCRRERRIRHASHLRVSDGRFSRHAPRTKPTIRMRLEPNEDAARNLLGEWCKVKKSGAFRGCMASRSRVVFSLLVSLVFSVVWGPG
jgi:hypothetical protein